MCSSFHLKHKLDTHPVNLYAALPLKGRIDRIEDGYGEYDIRYTQEAGWQADTTGATKYRNSGGRAVCLQVDRKPAGGGHRVEARAVEKVGRKQGWTMKASNLKLETVGQRCLTSSCCGDVGMSVKNVFSSISAVGRLLCIHAHAHAGGRTPHLPLSGCVVCAQHG
jgi:hypothetical protein